MKISDIVAGARFRDPNLKSSPAHYRIHVVRETGPDRFTAEHVASGSVRSFGTSPEVVGALEAIPPACLVANLDALVGQKVRIELTDGGTLGGRVTAVLYNEIEIDGVKCREVKSLELDRSGSSSYPLREIKRITTVQG